MSNESSESSESINNNYSIYEICNSEQSTINLNSNNYTLVMEGLENNSNLTSSISNCLVPVNSISNEIVSTNTNINVQLTNSSTFNFINSESSIEEEQSTDYNNEESIITNEYFNLENNIVYCSDQYSMLYNQDVDNPFYKCKLKNLDYETDEDEKLMTFRIIYFWNYEFNYDYFSLKDLYIFNNKTDLFKSKLKELKVVRNNISNNTTGNIIKLNSNKNLSKLVNIYLIVYYDNAKSNIEFYGIFNQEIEENQLIENIKRESIYGKNGIVSYNSMTNLGENDFIILHRKLNII